MVHMGHNTIVHQCSTTVSVKANNVKTTIVCKNCNGLIAHVFINLLMCVLSVKYAGLSI